MWGYVLTGLLFFVVGYFLHGILSLGKRADKEQAKIFKDYQEKNN